jgi:hypothetical protein
LLLELQVPACTRDEGKQKGKDKKKVDVRGREESVDPFY